MNTRFAPQTMVALWIIGFAGSFLIQSVFQSWFASVTWWGPNIGWQTEIANWNLGLILVLWPIQKSREWSLKVIPGLAVLSLIFGLNHLQAFIRSETFQIGNLLGFTFNFLAVFAALWVWRKHGNS